MKLRQCTRTDKPVINAQQQEDSTRSNDTRVTTPEHLEASKSTGIHDSPIINLSDYPSTIHETNLLSKGLKFCPTENLDHIKLCSDLEAFFRRMRLREYYGIDQQTNNDTSDDISAYLSNNCHQKSKWTPQESLRNNTDTIIKPADKGGSIVIQNRDDYIEVGYRQLNNSIYYQQLQHDPTKQFKKDLQHLIGTYPTDIGDKFRGLIPDDPKPGTFYTLPKLHKPNNIPGRPIMSGIGTLTEKISGLVETILNPIVKNTDCYIQETIDFLNKLADINEIPQNAILVTMDVESLYTTIPHCDGLHAVEHFSQDQGVNSIPVDVITKVTEFILTHNYFVFEDNIYLQMMGTAMGTRMAPQYANLFMALLESEFLKHYHLKPLIYLRFIDDTFMIWTHGEEELKNFLRAFNTYHNSITLKMDYSTESVHFLDITVILKENQLQTSLYRNLQADTATFILKVFIPLT